MPHGPLRAPHRTPRGRWRPTLAQVAIAALLTALLMTSAEAHLAREAADAARRDAATARMLIGRLQVDAQQLGNRLTRLERAAR